MAALRRNFEELEYRPGVSFIYRLLGGIRGTDEQIRSLAEFFALYDELAVNKYGLSPNSFYFLGTKRTLVSQASNLASCPQHDRGE